MKKTIAIFCVAMLLTTTNLLAQSLPLSGGALTGTVTGPAFIQTGAVRDFAPEGTITTTGSNLDGGAIGRSFNALTELIAGQSFTVDLTDARTINYITFGTHWAGDSRLMPTGFSIDYSNDNSSWTNYTTVTGNSNLYPVYSLNISARYWRITCNATVPGFPAHITGLKLIGIGIGAVGENYWNSPYGGDNIYTKTPVSIGTTDNPSPGYMLGVNGGILASKVLVTTFANWPDYVFKPNYHLKPLSEVKSYIEMNHHLPEMPAAAKVEKDGQDLGEMNKLLLKKVEELTLYLIDQNKKVERQQKELDNFKRAQQRLNRKFAAK